jgi:hypothetical protein
MLAWTQNPVPLSQLDSFDPLKCESPQLSQPICDGIPANEQGLLALCDFPDFPFFTCVSLGERSDCPVPDDIILVVWLSFNRADS